MTKKLLTKTEKQLLLENEKLRSRLAETEEALNAIRNGKVDAIVVPGDDGKKIFSLTSAETPYRIIVEEMNEGTATVSADGIILYCNRRFAELVSTPLEKVTGSNFIQFIAENDKPKYDELLHTGLKKRCSGEITSLIYDSNPVYFYLSFSPLPPDLLGDVCIMAVDITELKKKEEELRRSHDTLEQRIIERTAELNIKVQELDRHSKESLLIGEMTGMMQLCRSKDEAKDIISRYLGHLYPDTAGSLYLVSSQNTIDLFAFWGNWLPNEFIIRDQCWGIRLGKIHIINNIKTDIICEHILNNGEMSIDQNFICIPVFSTGSLLGLISIKFDNKDSTIEEITNDSRIIMMSQTISINLGLSLTNLILREELREQSIHDPLTGLFNRRYLDAEIELEQLRLKRNQISIGFIMIDIDHFKKFNDTFGHDAGDFVLKTISKFIMDRAREGDIACRYGGEEFILGMYGATLDILKERADMLWKEVQDISLEYQG